jgi:hypothetical protein
MTDEELQVMRDQLRMQLESLRRTQVGVAMGHEAQDCTLQLIASMQRTLGDIERLVEARKERRREPR